MPHGRARRARHPQDLQRRGGAPRRGLHAPRRPGPRLVGQNGAGKSTLVKIIDGAYTADEGEVTVAATPGADRSDRTRSRHRDGVPGVQPHPTDDAWARTSCCRASPRADSASSTTGGPPTARRAPRPRRSGRRSATARGGTAGRLAAAGRDRQGDLAGRQHPHPRRADRHRSRPPRSTPSWARSVAWRATASRSSTSRTT